MKVLIDELKSRTEKIKLGECDGLNSAVKFNKFITVCFICLFK